MIKTFTGTTAQELQSELMDARQHLGAASGMVFTLVVVADLREHADVMAACAAAGREHPSRIIVLTEGNARADRLDAELHFGEQIPGEIVSLRLQGELAQHRESVVLPLLLPDSPVIAWWPTSAPPSLTEDGIGALASRRISDALRARDPLGALLVRARHLEPGDTDLAWTRLTPWRALLVAALDQFPGAIHGVQVEAEAENAAAELLAAWLDHRLSCEVTLTPTAGPGITSVRLATAEGDIVISREDGRMASFSAPGTPRRTVALRRRDVNQLITEELRHLDADEVLAATMATLLHRHGAADTSERSQRALSSGRRSQVE